MEDELKAICEEHGFLYSIKTGVVSLPECRIWNPAFAPGHPLHLVLSCTDTEEDRVIARSVKTMKDWMNGK